MRKHLKLCLLLSLFLAIFSVAFADTVMIGSGTTTTSYLPIYGLYGYNYTQQIYTQNQIDYAGEIEKIRFYYVSGMITNCKDWTIYMGHTDKTSFGTTTDWVPITELTEVYSGDVSSFLPTANNWMEIPLDTVFDYNNLNNLVIAVHEHTPGYNSMSWGAFTSGTATGIYYYNDNNNPDPANPPIASGRTGSINRLQLVFPSTTPPLAPTLVAPANNAVNQDMPILSWQATSGGGDPSTYDLYLGTDPNPPLFAEDLNQASYQFTVYDYETDYYWKVVAKNHLGSSPESETWKFTTRLDPNRPLPYFQDFDSGTSLAAIEWGGDMYISSTHGADGTNGLYKNMYSYTNTTNVVSCPIGPMLPNSELKFDYRFVEYSNYPNNPKVLVAGDEILVQISTDGGITYTTIHTIDHTNHTNTNQFTTATVNLSAYDSGNVKFKLVTNWGGGDYYIDIDNFMVREVPEYPILSINPDALDFGSIRENTVSDYQNIVVRNIGVGILNVGGGDIIITGSDANHFEIDDSLLPFTLEAGDYENLPIRFVPNSAGFKSATIQIVNSATSDVHEATLSGLAVGENDLFESFEATTFPPAGWANPGSWSRSTSYKVDGDASAYKYGNTSTQFILRTPMLDVNAGDVFNFWSLVGTITGKLQLVYSEDENTWTQIGADLEHAATSTWHNQTVDISSLAGSSYYFGIRTGLQSSSFYVDLVAGPQPTPMSPGTPTLSAPANASTNQNEMPELRWTVPTSGGVAFGYNIYLDTDPNPTTLFAQSTTNSLLVASPLDWNTTYYWKVAAYNNTGEGVASDIYSFTVKEDSTIRTFPFVEGFEDGYTQGQAVAGHWTQITGPEFTSRRWTANRTETGYNRTPRTGSWNAYMQWSGESTLVRPIALEGGKNYKLELYARQDGAVAANAKIKASYGLSGTLANLNESIIEETGIVNGDYQQLEGYFSPADDGIYYIGITGWINGSPYYLSIDDIKIIEISDDPVLSYSPESIDFGDTIFGTAVGPRNITITNDGGGSLELVASDLEIVGPEAAMFSFDDSVFPVSLETGINASIPVFVTGTVEGAASATLIINYDGVGHEVALSANILPDGLVMIGDGTADNKMPVNPWYGYSYAQMLYKADEILTQDRQIEKVAYHWNGVNIGGNSDQWTIYMGHTDKEAFDSTTDWIDINELTEVFQGDVAILAEDTWIEIMLQMPFVYNGTDNLVIAVHETRPGNDGNVAFFYNTPSTAGRSLRCHSDSANPEPAAPPTGTLTAAYPNIRMYFGDVPDEPVLSITPDSWDAGEIKINTQASQQFTIRNIGGGTLVVNELEVSGDYFTLAAPFTGASLETAESVQFTVNFDPLATGDYQGSITVDTSVGVENIDLEGSCFDPTIYEFPHTEDFDGEWTGSPAAPAGWTVINANNDSYTWRQSSQYISPTHSAPYAANGTGNTDDYLITPPIMMSTNDLRLKWWDKVERASYPNKYKILISTTDTETSSFTEELLDVTCTNTAWTEKSVDINAATYNGTIFVAFYQYASTSAVWGFGIDDFSIEELSSTPIFAADQDSYDFGETMINTTDSKSIMVGNIGGGELVITGIEISGDDAFALGTHPTLPATLERDEFINFDVTFSPTAVGDYNATIIITDNLNNRYSVNAGSRRSNNTHSRAANTVTLTGSCFDPTIRTFPFFEGFEDGNTHNTTAINQWEQIIGTGTKQWTANNSFTDRNRTPRSGSWNIFLQYSGESTLIRPIMLEANQEYKLTFYARQDHANRTHANVKAKFGAGNTLDDLTETIIEQTNVGDGNYQEFSGVFSTETAGIYFIGITGWISGTPWYLSLDDITIDYNYIVTPNDHADVGGDTTALVTGAGFVGALDVPVDPEDLTPIPNPSFVVINHQVWQLIGTGEINLRFDNNGTEDIWFSHVVGGAWLPQEIPAGGHINVTVNLDAKDASFEFALGRGGNPTLPVELSYFNAVFMLNENSVKLSWKTESETQMLGYQIYRSMDTELANAILITPQIVTASNSSTGDSYSYLDKEVESGTYYYWLEAVSYNSSDYYGYQTVVIDIPSAPELPEISSMGNAYPNPFKNATSIDIAIKGGETGSFTIYNMLGQAVYREKLSEGNVTIQWHGKDNNGNRCGSGVYFYKLVTPTKAETKKMVIMK